LVCAVNPHESVAITTMSFHPLDKKNNLHEAYSRPFHVAGHQLLLVHSNGVSHILQNRCPHEGGVLHEGSVRDGKIYCDHQGYFFDLDSGQCGDAALSGEVLTKYDVQFKDDVVGVCL
jgi:nitrite reductase/ring-hydroxylating ferredoxin subunit